MSTLHASRDSSSNLSDGNDLADAYSVPEKRWPLKPLSAPTLGIAIAYLVQSMLNQWALPASVLALGSGMSFLGTSTLRLTFPHITDRLQAANAPAFWQKLELPPAPLGGLKRALLPGGILLVVILYLLRR